MDLKVVSGASQDHVTDPDAWVALKNSTFFVTLQADVEPQVQEAADFITWSGGQEVSGNKFLRQVDRKTARKETVSVGLGPDTKSVDIWVTWATVELHSSGTMSSTDGILVPITGFAFPKLGPLTDDTNYSDGLTTAEAGHVEVIGKISPSGIEIILDPADSGWEWKQYYSLMGCLNGQITEIKINRPDDPERGNQDVALQADDQIYFIDAPTVGLGFAVPHTAERYQVFLDFAAWDGKLGSDSFQWHYFVQIDDDLDAASKPRNHDTVMNELRPLRLTNPSGLLF